MNSYDEVDTGKLLQSLEEATSHKTLADSSLEALDVAGRANAHLVAVVGHNLSELLNDSGVVDRETAQLSEGSGGLFMTVLLDKEARGLRKEDEPRLS